jgi:peptidyl-prolyl cis-trans isomerase D
MIMRSRKTKRLNTAGPESEQKSTATKWKHPFLYVFSFLILIIIVVTFIGGPLITGFGGSANIVFGSWGGRDIRFVQGNYLSRQRDMLYDQLLESGSSQSYEWQAYSVWKGAYDRTVVHTAILEISERSGLYVSENRVDQVLLRSGPYMVNGEFSEEVYRNTSNADRYQYRSLVKDDLIHQQFLTDLNHEGLFGANAAEFLRDMAADERAFRFVSLGYGDFPAAEVLAYAQENRGLFRRIKLSRITVTSSEQEAEAIRKQIVDGIQTFEDQAKNHSVDGFAEKGGEMGWREYQALRTDFSDPADLDSLFSLAAGSLSPVFETSFGFVFYRVDEPSSEMDAEAPETMVSVRSYMERYERGLIEDYLISRLEEFRAAVRGGETFEGIAGSMSLPILETDYFPVNYGASFFLKQPQLESGEANPVLESAPYTEAFYSTLFSLEDNEPSAPIVIDEYVAVFTLIDSRVPAPEEISFLADYYPFIYQQFLDQDLSDYLLSSDEFEDNFLPVFSQLFLTE